jgi:hypothetical protein
VKHFADLNKEEQEKFVAGLDHDLTNFFRELNKNYSLCDICLHKAVVMMCQNYIEEQEAMPSDARH